MHKILVDGKNLSMASGTGIATYARGVCAAHQDLGYETKILFGENAGKTKSEILDEITFFDNEPEYGLPRRAAGLAISGLRALISARPYRIHNSGFIDRHTFENQMPDIGAEIWNSQSLFRIANHRFTITGAMQKIENVMSADIAHWTAPLPVFLNNCANIYTIHDIIPLVLPETTLDNKKYYFHLVNRIIDHASAILTVSETSRTDILNLFPEAESKIFNTYQPVMLPDGVIDISDDQLASELKGSFGFELGQYVLYFGAIEPKKNVKRLIEAYLAASIDIPLIIAGSEAWLSEGELAPLENANIEYLTYKKGVARKASRVMRMGYVPRMQLYNLIRGAKFVVFPSLYEGFGLPIIEAMLCGTPVLTSNSGAMAEISGSAALHVDPYDVRSLSSGIRRMNFDPELRRRLHHDGIEKANRFSLGSYCKRLDPVYTQIRENYKRVRQ